MADTYISELQDDQGNPIHPTTSAEAVICADKKTAQEKLSRYEEALGTITGVTDLLEVDRSDILVTSKALHALYVNFSDAHSALVESLQYSGLGVTEDMKFEEICAILAEEYPEWSKVFTNNKITWSKSGTGSISLSDTMLTFNATYGGSAGNIATIESSVFNIPLSFDSLKFSLYASCGDLVDSSITLYWVDTNGKTTELGKVNSNFDRNGKTANIINQLSILSEHKGFFRAVIYCGARQAVTNTMIHRVENLEFI